LSDDLSIKTIADFGAGSKACQAGATRYFLVREKFRDCKNGHFSHFRPEKLSLKLLSYNLHIFAKTRLSDDFAIC
jgi:hypothetical protein